MRICLSPLALLLLLSLGGTGCATIRTTDPPRTATEQFLLSGAASRAIDQLSSESLRDRRVFIDTAYLGSAQTANEYAFLVGELRAKLLLSGIRLVPKREEAQVLLELRSGGLGGVLAAVLGALDVDEAERLARLRTGSAVCVAVVLDADSWAPTSPRARAVAAAAHDDVCHLLLSAGWRVLPVAHGTPLEQVWPLAGGSSALSGPAAASSSSPTSSTPTSPSPTSSAPSLSGAAS